MGELGTLLKEETYMNKIVDYDILSNKSYDELIEEVKEAMKNGWQPLGGAFNVVSPIRICQTIVKYEE